MRENFDKLAKRKDWVDPNSPTSPNKFTVHRQGQLAEILKQYGGRKSPFSHFTSEIVDSPAKIDMHSR